MCSRSDGQLRATNCLALFHRVCLCIQENPPSRRTSVAPQPTVQPHEIEPPAGCATARTLVLTVAGRRRWRSGAARRRAGERQLLAGRLTVARRECPRGAGVRSGPFGPTAYTSLPWITRAADAIGSALSHGLSPPPPRSCYRSSQHQHRELPQPRLLEVEDWPGVAAAPDRSQCRSRSRCRALGSGEGPCVFTSMAPAAPAAGTSRVQRDTTTGESEGDEGARVRGCLDSARM